MVNKMTITSWEEIQKRRRKNLQEEKKKQKDATLLHQSTFKDENGTLVSHHLFHNTSGSGNTPSVIVTIMQYHAKYQYPVETDFLLLVEFIIRYMCLARYPFIIAKLMPITINQIYIFGDYCS